MSHKPPLSVVVATILPWPALQMCMESMYEQARALDAEIIIAMRPGGLPENAYPDAVRVVEPNGTLFTLRAAAFGRARGAVVALTEDHCRVRPDWCASIIHAHTKRPEVHAMIGCIENTARARRSEWATYLLGNGTFMAPLGHGDYRGAVSSANASFKRDAIPERFPAFGWSGSWYTHWLYARGHSIKLDPTPVVDHELSVSMREACAIFYYYARASTALEANVPGGRAILSALRGLATTPFDAVRTGLRVAVRKGRFRAAAITSIPAVALLMIAHNCGVIRAALSGPGDAPELLR